MDAKLLAKIALRVLAVYIVSIGILELPQIATMNIGTHELGALIFAVFIFMEIAPFALGVFLWLIAPRIGDWIVGKSSSGAPAEAVGVVELQTIAFVTVGLLIAIQAAAYIIGVIYSSLLVASWPGKRAGKGVRALFCQMPEETSVMSIRTAACSYRQFRPQVIGEHKQD